MIFECFWFSTFPPANSDQKSVLACDYSENLSCKDMSNIVSSHQIGPLSAPATPWCGTGRTSAVQEDPARTVEAPGPVTQSQHSWAIQNKTYQWLNDALKRAGYWMVLTINHQKKEVYDCIYYCSNIDWTARKLRKEKSISKPATQSNEDASKHDWTPAPKEWSHVMKSNLLLFLGIWPSGLIFHQDQQQNRVTISAGWSDSSGVVQSFCRILKRFNHDLTMIHDYHVTKTSELTEEDDYHLVIWWSTLW
jgi:hypothetical protein